LKKLRKLVEKNKSYEVKKLLGIIIETYNSNSKIVDNLYCEQNKLVKLK